MDINSLDPSRTWCDTCIVVKGGVYQTLVTVDPNNPARLIPDLATSWQSNADSTQFTFNLNPKAKFADGSPVTSADVKWSFDREVNLAGGASFMFAGYKGTETPHPETAIVTFSAPDSPFLQISSSVLSASVLIRSFV